MRIICPDCGAQYEVPDEVIPDEGRDVQCSNCDAIWMFEHPDHPGTTGARTRDDEEPDSPEDDDAPVTTLPRRDLDPRVTEILRAEAEREREARAADANPEPLEVQPELGLTVGRDASAEATPDAGSDADADADPADSGSPAAARSEPAEAGNMTVSAAAAAAPRGDRLPDAEEISSSLRSMGPRDAEVPASETGSSHRRREFRFGILLAALIFVGCLAAYRFAPEIAGAVPQSDPWLSSYVTWVDEMRAILDAKMREGLDWLNGSAAAAGE